VTSTADQSVVVYGAGGHGRVVAEAAGLAGFRVVGFIDDAPTVLGIGDVPVFRPGDPLTQTAAWIVAIGDNAARAAIVDRCLRAGRSLISVVHPRAFVSPTASLGRGVFVAAGAIVHSHAHLGDGVIVNSGAIVEHDAELSGMVHIAPGAVLGGGVRVERGALVGLGSRVLPGLRLGCGATIGAGSVVLTDVDDGATVVGIPGRVVRP
jgi:sugar O-acyltransferase (sialic acid O-acetyltransferase NeuD family)